MTRRSSHPRKRAEIYSTPVKKAKPESIASALSDFLKKTGVSERIEAAQVVSDWPKLVGKQIAKVTQPLFVTRDGILFVAVKTNSWMSELSLLEPQLLTNINAASGRAKVKKIRLQLMR